MKFADLQENFQVSILHKDGGLAYYKGKIIKKGMPRYLDVKPNQAFAQAYGNNPIERVIDLTVEYNGQTTTFPVFENRVAQSDNKLTIACTDEIINSEINSIGDQAKHVVENVDYYKKMLEDCDKIKAQINPAYAASKEKDEKISSMERELKMLREESKEKDAKVEKILNQNNEMMKKLELLMPGTPDKSETKESKNTKK